MCKYANNNSQLAKIDQISVLSKTRQNMQKYAIKNFVFQFLKS